ncbi:MAG: DUF493 domain-containing protein [Phycisphaerales bacterium]|nr:DUF493 domain-containing protein [Phycisphaerales bacterium]
MQRPTIEYPCEWQFRVIGEQDEAIRAVIAEVFGDREHTVKAGNVSSSGRWRSIEVSAQVQDEADRDAKFQQLSEAEAVRAVV